MTLPDPGSLPLVTAEQKGSCVTKLAAAPGAGGEIASDVADSELVPLVFFSRAPALCSEFLHQLSATRFVDFSPGSGDFLSCCVERQSLDIDLEFSCLKIAGSVIAVLLIWSIPKLIKEAS